MRTKNFNRINDYLMATDEVRHSVSTVKTEPIFDQLTVTNVALVGLEKLAADFDRKNYTENFVQACFNVLKINKTFLVGGLGNSFSLWTILKVRSNH